MVFHGDYEVEFEIYQTKEDTTRSKLLGYMVGISADDAKIRWSVVHEASPEEEEQIVAVVPLIL